MEAQTPKLTRIIRRIHLVNNCTNTPFIMATTHYGFEIQVDDSRAIKIHEFVSPDHRMSDVIAIFINHSITNIVRAEVDLNQPIEHTPGTTAY